MINPVFNRFSLLNLKVSLEKDTNKKFEIKNNSLYFKLGKFEVDAKIIKAKSYYDLKEKINKGVIK
jgi:hypothetical protein